MIEGEFVLDAGAVQVRESAAENQAGHLGPLWEELTRGGERWWGNPGKQAALQGVEPFL